MTTSEVFRVRMAGSEWARKDPSHVIARLTVSAEAISVGTGLPRRLRLLAVTEALGALPPNSPFLSP